LLGKRIKSLRKGQELTQDQLAEFLNVSRQSVWGYENNDIEPSLDVLIKIADRFNVSLDYLLCRTEEKYNSNISTATANNKDIVLKIHDLLNELKY